MAITATRVTAGVAAVALNTAETGGTTLIITNTSATNVNADLGLAAVTAGTGFVLAGGATITVALDSGDVLYAIRSQATDATLSVLHT